MYKHNSGALRRKVKLEKFINEAKGRQSITLFF